MNKVASISKDFDALGETINRAVETVNRKPSDAVADHSIAIFEHASAEVDKAADHAIKCINETRALKKRKIAAAKAAVCESMEWVRYQGEISTQIADSCAEEIAKDARPV